MNEYVYITDDHSNLQEKETTMLKKGQFVYRFKFNFTDSDLEITHHTFEIADVKESVCGGEPCIEYRPKCVEDYKIKYKDGHYIQAERFDFDKVKPSGDSIYVLLKENDEEKAKSLVSEYLDAKIRDIKSELYYYEDLKSIFNK